MKLYFHGFRSALALVLAVTTFLPALGLKDSAFAMLPQEQVPSKKAPKEDFDSFIIESVHGKSTCRGAKDEEAFSTLPKHKHEGVPVEQLLPASKLPGGDNAENGLTINFVALSQLQSDPDSATVIAAFQRAAAIWTVRIKSPITISVNIDYGPNFPGGDPFGANTLGSTISARTLIDYPGARTNLIAGASSPAEAAIYNGLPASSAVPVDAGNGAVVAVNRSVAFALGIPVPSPGNLNVATIAFNDKFPFDFNPDNGISPGQTDFVAVAAHEIGHALGFTSGAGQGHVGNISLWDLYRFRPGTASGAFSTAQRIMTMGGQQVHFTGQAFTFDGFPTNELGLSTGGPDGDAGDLRQSSHWKDDELATGYVGIMDPTISAGVLEQTTENDFAALEAIGWNLLASVPPPPAPPPPPVPANDNFASAQIITGCSGSVTGTTIGATRQSGELGHLSEVDPGGSGSRSIWYQWQPPVSSVVTISTAGSRFDTILGIYTATSVTSLSGAIVGQHDDADFDNDDRTSRLSFTANSGTTYRIAVDGYNNAGSGGDFGPVTLNWSATNCTVTTPPQILLEESGAAADTAAAFDSILWLRDPFLVLNTGNLINPAADRNTRVVILVANISPSLPAVVTLTNPSNQSQDINAQDVRAVPNQDFRQVTFRLPTGLVAGTYKIKVTSNGQTSNTASLRIRT